MSRAAERERLVHRLLTVSEDALTAAKIEHREAFDSAMVERGKLIARLAGLPEDDPLPAYSDDLSASLKERLSGFERQKLARLKELDRGILVALEAQMNRLKENQNLVDRGKRFMTRMQSISNEQSGGRVDRVG